MDWLKKYFAQLRRLSAHRSYRRLLFGGSISALGDRVGYIAFLAAITAQSYDVFAIGGITISEMLPAVLSLPLVSLVVDRYDRRKLMLVADLVRAVLFVVVVIFPQTWLLFVVAFIAASFAMLFDPARQALEPHYLPEGEIAQAGGIRQGLMNLVMIVGPALGGLLVAVFGYRSAFIFDAVSFLISGWMVSGLDHVALALDEGHVDNWKEIKGGFEAVSRSPILRHIFGMFAAFTLVIGIQYPLIFIFVRENLHGGTTEAGWLFSAIGIGGIIGGAIIATLKKESTMFDTNTIRGRRNVAAVIALDGLVVMLFAAFDSLLPVLLFFTVFGFVGTVLVTALTAAVTLQSPVESRGRVFTLYSAMSGPLIVLSIVLGMPFAKAYGASLVFYVSGALEIVVGAITWRASSRSLLNATKTQLATNAAA